jgi:hypothetical protein
VTTVRRGWRSGLELVLLVSTLVLGVGLSLLTNETPAGPIAPIGRSSAFQLLNAADAAGACQLSANRASSSSDSSDADDDDDDGDDACTLPTTIASPPPQIDRAVSWLLIHPVFEPLSSLASDGHSLRAPPQ